MTRAHHRNFRGFLPFWLVMAGIILLWTGLAVGWSLGVRTGDGLLVGTVILRPSRPFGGLKWRRTAPVATRYTGVIKGLEGPGVFYVTLSAGDVAEGAPESVRLVTDARTEITAWLPKTDAEIEKETGQSRAVRPGAQAHVLKDVREQYRRVALRADELSLDDIIDFDAAADQDRASWRTDAISWVAAYVDSGRAGESQVYVKGRFPQYENAR